MRALMADPDDTGKAMDVANAVGPADFERTFQRFCADRRGQQLLREKPSLAAALSDRAALARLPEGSLGHAYADYLAQNGYEATALVELQNAVRRRWEQEEGSPPLDPWRAWFSERLILLHDIQHVLTDYGTDGVGEATLLAFNLAQVGGRANGLLTLGAAFEAWRFMGRPWFPYLFRAWRRGRAASSLVALPYEELLPLRLDTLRRLTGLADSLEAHPGGILRGDVDEAGIFHPA
jgi:ubiquinone biosynthesis protein COQ4